MKHKIIHGNSLEILREMEKESVDLTITSPKYNLGNNHHTGSKRHEVYFDLMPEGEYQGEQIDTLNEIHRITKARGSLFYNHKNRIKDGLSIVPYQWIFKTKWLVKQEIVWWNGGQNFDGIRFYPQTERIYWLVKSSRTKLHNSNSLLDIWHINPVGAKGKHTRQFPIKLVNNILICFEGAKVILDPFCGSGTVGVVAERLGRNSILIDKKREYCKLSYERLSFTVGQLKFDEEPSIIEKVNF